MRPKPPYVMVPPTVHAPLKSNHQHSTVPSSSSAHQLWHYLPQLGYTPDGCNPDGNSTVLALFDFWQPQLNNPSSVLLYGWNGQTVPYLKSPCAWAHPKISTVVSQPALTVLHRFRHQHTHMDTHNLPWDQGRERAAWLLLKYTTVPLYLMSQLEEQETQLSFALPGSLLPQWVHITIFLEWPTSYWNKSSIVT